MPRTPIPAHLVHQPDAVAADAQAFDRLCAIFDEISRPFIAAGLKEQSLDAAPVSAEETAEETRWFAQRLAAAWVTSLTAVVVEYQDALLGDTLLPDDFNAQMLADYPVSREEITQIMKDFAQRAFESSDKLTLPMDVEIEKTPAAGLYLATLGYTPSS